MALSDALRDAGVQIRSMKVGSDLRYRTRVQVSLAESSDPKLAGQVLGQYPGQYPFPFWLSDDALGRPL